MTQLQYQEICEILKSGAPALANDLISSLNNIIQDNQQMSKKLDEMEKETQKSKNNKETKKESK